MPYRFYSWVAMGGAAVTVGGGIAVFLLITYLRAWKVLWTDWLTSVDHKKIGIMYVVLALVMLVRGFVDAIMMRAQQAIALNNEGYLPPEHFEQIFSSHGTIMIFFVAMPFLTGLINIIVPQQIGARDVAFPFLNSVSLWLTAAGAGWCWSRWWSASSRPGRLDRLSALFGHRIQPGVGVDYWLWALIVSGVGSTAVRDQLHRHDRQEPLPGHDLYAHADVHLDDAVHFDPDRLRLSGPDRGRGPAHLDRTLGFHFFTNGDGGNMMMFANLLWIWGHPEVYILILPAFGIFSEVVATFSRKRLFGYKSRWSMRPPASRSCPSRSGCTTSSRWARSANVNAVFGIATMIIAVPTGVKIFDWMFTMYRAGSSFIPSMVFTIGFMVTFVIGGVTGVLLALPPADYLMHNSTFLVAHFHNMLIPGALFGYFAGLNYWFPKGLRLQAGRQVGHPLLLVLDHRLLSRLHAALRARFHGHEPAHGALRGPELAALLGGGRAGRRLCAHAASSASPSSSMCRRADWGSSRDITGDPVERPDAGMGNVVAARPVQFRSVAGGQGLDAFHDMKILGAPLSAATV